MRYAIAQFRHEQERKAYRIYVTDTLQLIAENTAAPVGGRYIIKRFVDVIDPPKEDTRTCEEITAEIASRCGLTINDGKTQSSGG